MGTRIKETLEYFDNNGTVVKKRKAKYIGECPSESVFKQACDKLLKKIEGAAISRMNIADVVCRDDHKMVVEIKMCLVFEYNQRWTYEWV